MRQFLARLIPAILAVAALPAAPAMAQATFPTNVPGIRAGGQVLMKCDASANGPINCRPVTSADPFPTSGGGGGPVTIADGADTAEGRTTDPAFTGGTGAATLASLQRGLYNLLTTLSGQLPASLGQRTTAQSLAVALSSDGTYAKTTDITAMQLQLHNDLIASTPAGSANIGSVTGWAGYIEIQTPLAASATVAGGMRTSPVWGGYFGCRLITATQSTNLIVQETVDATNFYTIAGPLAVAAGSSGDLVLRVRGAGQYRCIFQNTTATANTVTIGVSSFTAN